MASTKEYLDFVLEQLSLLDDITYKAMMNFQNKKRNKTLEYSYQFLSIYFKVPWYNFRNRRLP